MQNFARTGSFYTELLSSLEANDPGLKDRLSKTGYSIHAQDRYPHRAPEQL